MLRKTVTAYLFLILGVFVVSSSGPVKHRIIEEEATSADIDLRRFILTDNVHEKWISWQQHVACLTRCVQGYELETVGCCSTGDNRLCFGLPWKLLNNSVGSCAGFCDKVDQISCKFAQSAVCGSDGKIYENSCEFAKARCVNKLLIQEDTKFCNNYRVTSTFSQNVTGYTSPLSMAKVSTTSMLSSTIATKSILSTLALASTMHTDSTTKSTVSSITAQTQSTVSSIAQTQSTVSSIAQTKSTVSSIAQTQSTVSSIAQTQSTVSSIAQTQSTVSSIAQTQSTVSSNALTKSSVSSKASTTLIMSSYVPNTTVPTNAKTSPIYSSAPTSTAPTKAISSTASTDAPTPPSYCQNRHSISCGFTFKIVCGSDGKIYANLCMLALGRCDNPYLTQKDC